MTYIHLDQNSNLVTVLIGIKVPKAGGEGLSEKDSLSSPAAGPNSVMPSRLRKFSAQRTVNSYASRSDQASSAMCFSAGSIACICCSIIPRILARVPFMQPFQSKSL
jgi:hypothetical protein